ncbi:hypothetical protein P0O24_11855 [Methanotrichaceae archaeon M04Ac]|uniref:Uncharacterized protein n=2 Tax=Candidatus Methanocrinis alkalitolerans TaxID=3033395 RepID=A0ABT5XHT0_9EURY|nr:hypothetical protein [Candidatus Methanocrinis alkalitolerans]
MISIQSRLISILKKSIAGKLMSVQTVNAKCRIDDLIAEYSLRHDLVISAIVYPSKTFQECSTPFLLSVKEDGIAI